MAFPLITPLDGRDNLSGQLALAQARNTCRRSLHQCFHAHKLLCFTSRWFAPVLETLNGSRHLQFFRASPSVLPRHLQFFLFHSHGGGRFGTFLVFTMRGYEQGLERAHLNSNRFGAISCLRFLARYGLCRRRFTPRGPLAFGNASGLPLMRIDPSC